MGNSSRHCNWVVFLIAIQVSAHLNTQSDNFTQYRLQVLHCFNATKRMLVLDERFYLLYIPALLFAFFWFVYFGFFQMLGEMSRIRNCY